MERKNPSPKGKDIVTLSPYEAGVNYFVYA